MKFKGKMKYGIYKGLPFDKVPADYLCYLMKRGIIYDKELETYLIKNKDLIISQNNGE